MLGLVIVVLMPTILVLVPSGSYGALAANFLFGLVDYGTGAWVPLCFPIFSLVRTVLNGAFVVAVTVRYFPVLTLVHRLTAEKLVPTTLTLLFRHIQGAFWRRRSIAVYVPVYVIWRCGELLLNWSTI